MTRHFGLRNAALFLICVLFPLQTLAQDDRPQIRFGAISLKPYGFKDAYGEAQGTFYEISQAILRAGGFGGYVEIVPIPRAIQPGATDCAFLAKTDPIDRKYIAIGELGVNLQAGVLPRKGISLKRYEDLFGIPMAVLVGTQMGEPFQSDTALQKVMVRDYDGAMAMFEKKRVDATVGAVGSMRYAAKVRGINAGRFGEPFVLFEIPQVLYCHPDSPTKPYWGEIAETLERLKANGSITRILQRYQ